MRKKRVLLVEDEEVVVKLVKISLKRKGGEDIEILWANDLVKAKRMFQENEQSLNLVALDACVPGTSINSLPFLDDLIKAGFAGPIIATSAIPKYRVALITAGATDSCPKEGIANKIKELLL